MAKKKSVNNSRKGKKGKQLTKKQREELKDTIRRMHVLSGVSLREIGRQTGYDLNTVRRWYDDIKKELQKEYDEMYGGTETIARALMRKEQRVQQLTRLALSADNSSDRISALRLAEQIDENTKSTLQDLGIVARKLGEIREFQRTEKVFVLEDSEYDA